MSVWKTDVSVADVHLVLASTSCLHQHLSDGELLIWWWHFASDAWCCCLHWFLTPIPEQQQQIRGYFHVCEAINLISIMIDGEYLLMLSKSCSLDYRRCTGVIIIEEE